MRLSRSREAVPAAIAWLCVLLTWCPGSAAAQAPPATGPASIEDLRVQLRLAPDEPDAVVLEFQRLMTRQPNIMNQAGLVREIALWEAVTSANPQSLAAA